MAKGIFKTWIQPRSTWRCALRTPSCWPCFPTGYSIYQTIPSAAAKHLASSSQHSTPYTVPTIRHSCASTTSCTAHGTPDALTRRACCTCNAVASHPCCGPNYTLLVTSYCNTTLTVAPAIFTIRREWLPRHLRLAHCRSRLQTQRTLPPVTDSSLLREWGNETHSLQKSPLHTRAL